MITSPEEIACSICAAGDSQSVAQASPRFKDSITSIQDLSALFQSRRWEAHDFLKPEGHSGNVCRSPLPINGEGIREKSSLDYTGYPGATTCSDCVAVLAFILMLTESERASYDPSRNRRVALNAVLFGLIRLAAKRQAQ